MRTSQTRIATAELRDVIFDKLQYSMVAEIDVIPNSCINFWPVRHVG